MKKIILLFFILGCLLKQNYAQTIDWSKLKNPIYSNKDWSVKDACMIFNKADSNFYIFFSAFYFDNGRERSHVSAVMSKDLINFSEPLFI